MPALRKYPDELRARAVRMVFEVGQSTRRVDRLVEQLGIAGMSGSGVQPGAGAETSRWGVPGAAAGGPLPYLWLDAKVEQVREPGEVRDKALVITYGGQDAGK